MEGRKKIVTLLILQLKGRFPFDQKLGNSGNRMKWKGSIPKRNPYFGVYVGIFVPTFRENQKISHLYPCFLYSHPAFQETNGLEGKYSLPSVIKSVVILRLRRKLVNRAGFFPVEYNKIEKAVLFAACCFLSLVVKRR